MRLIDADALIEDIEEYQKSMVFHSYGERMHFDDMIDFAVDHIEEAHTVDAVPVIRCKDCKHRGGYHCPMYHTETSLDDLDGFDEYTVDRTDGDGFCHRGEKKG